MYDNDESIWALTKRLEAEDKKKAEVGWKDAPNPVASIGEACGKCKNCSASGHPCLKMRFDGVKGEVAEMYRGLDLKLCNKHGFRTRERSWCPNYENGTPKDAHTENLVMFGCVAVFLGFLICAVLFG